MRRVDVEARVKDWVTVDGLDRGLRWEVQTVQDAASSEWAAVAAVTADCPCGAGEYGLRVSLPDRGVVSGRDVALLVVGTVNRAFCLDRYVCTGHGGVPPVSVVDDE